MAQEEIRHTIFIDGNTVRKEAIYPVLPQTFTEQKKKINKRIAEQEKPERVSIITLAGIVLAAIITVILCVDYVQLQSDLRVKVKTINKMEEELAALAAENATFEKQVCSYIDLDYVYKVATEELGMRYPYEEQVVFYESTDTEYVRQYGSISKPETANEINILDYLNK